ncbi:hypothetical protein HHI36_016515, partial [Cryptolaemus montrouzieri]
VSHVMVGLVEYICEGKEYEYRADNVKASVAYTKKGQPRKRKKCKEPPAVRKQRKHGTTIESHKVLSPCSLKCKLRCTTLVSEQQHVSVFIN